MSVIKAESVEGVSMYWPSCDEHKKRWDGVKSTDYHLARENEDIHNTDFHKQPELDFEVSA